MILVGPLAGVRLWLAGIAPQPGESLALAAEGLLGLPRLLTGLLAAGVLGAFALASRPALTRRQAGWGAAAGLVVPFGWAATAYAGRAGFDMVPTESFSFAQPMGEALLWGMVGRGDMLPSFAVASVLGVVLGAALGSLIRREFHWEACDDARELRRQLLGAFLMGTGGVLALGCTIGQGLSALSLLSPSAPVVVLSILAGARLGLFVLVEGYSFRRSSG
jgi:hypothetical protein